MNTDFPVQTAAETEQPVNELGRTLMAEFERAESARRLTEENWVRNARQYAGEYEPSVLARIPKDETTGAYTKSTEFIRHTKAKCDVLKARLMDLLFPSNNARNWSIEASPNPEVPEMALMQEMLRREGKGEMVPPDQDVLVREVAEQRAEAMIRLIDDQLNANRISYKRVCTSVLRSGIIYGAGCLKGPLITHRPKMRYEQKVSMGENGKQVVEWKYVQRGDVFQPYFEFVPVWDLYPDPAANCPEQLNYLWQTHVKTRKEMQELASFPGFHGDVLRKFLANTPEGTFEQKPHEQELRSIGEKEQYVSSDDLRGRYRIMERWGYLSGRQLIEAGMDAEAIASMIPNFDAEASYGCNLWMTSTGVVIKCTVAPVEEVAIPYHFFRPYADDTGFWTEGLPDILRSPQTVINAATRMMLDNAAIAAGPQLAVNVDALATEEDPTVVHPHKVWLFRGHRDLQECFREIGVSSHTQELLTIIEKHAQFADETSFPRYMSGDNSGVRGAGDTASGLSMLMSMASMPVKDLVNEFDSGITEPFIAAMYRWNMRYSENNDVKGDYEVKATGSTSLIAQELMGKRLLEAMAVLTAPGMADQTDFATLYRTTLRSLDLPKEIQLSPEEVRFNQQQQMKMMEKAKLEALIGEMTKRNVPIEPELMRLVQQMVAGGMEAQQGGAGGPQ